MREHPPALTALGPEHLPRAVELSRAENWPHRLEDWEMILDLGRGVAALSEGRVVGTAIATVFGQVGLTSMVIVDASMRGRGLGRRLMEAVLASGAPQEWRLVATGSGLPLYRGLGFAERDRVIRHEGVLTGVAAPAGGKRAGGDGGIGWADERDLDAVARADTAATGADRARLVRALLDAGRLAVLCRDGTVAGYAALRPFGRGEVAGPVVAEDADGARALLAFLLADRAGCAIRVDTTRAAGLSPWLAGFGLAEAGGGIEMSRGAPVIASGGLHRYALAAQALG